AHAPAEVGERLDVVALEALPVIRDEEEPVAAPGHVAGDATVAAHRDGHGARVPVARYVADGDAPVAAELRGHDTDGRGDAMAPGAQAPEVRQGRDDADGAMPAHAERAHGVEEDDRG